MALALAILMIPLYFIHDPSKRVEIPSSIPMKFVRSEKVPSSVKQELYALFVGPFLVFLLALLWYFTYYYHLSFMSRYLEHQVEKNSRLHAFGRQQLEDRGFFFLTHKPSASVAGMEENVSSILHCRSRSMIRIVEDNEPTKDTHPKFAGIFGGHRTLRFAHHFSKHEEEWDQKRNAFSENRMRARCFSRDQSVYTSTTLAGHTEGGGGRSSLGGAPTSYDGGNDHREVGPMRDGRKFLPPPSFSARGDGGSHEPMGLSPEPFDPDTSNAMKKNVPSVSMNQDEEQMAVGFWSNENKVLLWLCCDEVHEAQAVIQRLLIARYLQSVEDFMDAVSAFLSRTA